MSSENSQKLIVVGSETAVSEKFNPKVIVPFFERSVSEETRRAYRRVTKEFFIFFRYKHPAEINQGDIHEFGILIRDISAL